MTFDQILTKANTDKIPSMSQEGRFYCDHLIQSQNLNTILEIGTGHGIWSIAMALSNPSVTITSLELNEKRASIARENIAQMNLADRITVIQGDALTYETKDYYDLILIDGPKGQNKALFERFIPFLNPNGVIVIDNLDFHGETLKDGLTQSRDLKQLVRKINDFKSWIEKQPDLIVVSVDIGDGLLLVSRKYTR
jgi:predicted O-methyltransferase YrrM